MTTDPSDIVERLRDHADKIVTTLGQMIGGPLTTRDDAVRYVETYLRETYVAEITRLRGLLRQAHGVIAHGPASGLAWKYTLDNIDDALNRPRVTECEKMLAKKLAGSSE